MNMPTLQYNQIRLTAKANNAAHLIACANARWQSFYDMDSDLSDTQMLDERFPLAHGSHADVRNYVVYYHHLLAFFDDGKQAGLANPKQFAALSGHKCAPDSLLLKDKGLHVEIVFDQAGERGHAHQSGIDDIQVEMSTVLIADFTELEDDEHATAMQNYQALLAGKISIARQQEHVIRINHERVFTDVRGEDYILSGCSPIFVRHNMQMQHGELFDNNQAIISEVLVA